MHLSVEGKGRTHTQRATTKVQKTRTNRVREKKKVRKEEMF
jgi:hypothetical protein